MSWVKTKAYHSEQTIPKANCSGQKTGVSLETTKAQSTKKGRMMAMPRGLNSVSTKVSEINWARLMAEWRELVRWMVAPIHWENHWAVQTWRASLMAEHF